MDVFKIINIFLSMGQCMEEISAGIKVHPSLGKLSLEQRKGKVLMKMTQTISGE